jgi:hypothetical protein
MISTRILAAGALALLAACQPGATDKPAQAAPPPPVLPKAQASVIALMSGVIAPTADIIWGAVGTVDGPKGPVDKKPTTDKDWAELRYKVLLMAEAANLLAVPDRTVLLTGEKLANPAGPGDLAPEKSEEKIKAEWPTYLAFAQTLQNAALATLKSVDAKDVDAFVEAGGAIDEACEQCHKRFWYPDAPTPP